MKFLDVKIFAVNDSVIVDVPLCAVFPGMVTKVHISRNKVTYDVQAIVDFSMDKKNRHKHTRFANVDGDFVFVDNEVNQWRIQKMLLRSTEEFVRDQNYNPENTIVPAGCNVLDRVSEEVK